MKILIFLIFVASANSIEIECEFGTGSWWVIGDIYACGVFSLNFSDDPERVTKISGNHEAGKTNEDVGLVDFYNFYLKIVPKKFSNFFPKLIALRFFSCPFEILPEDALEEYPNLEVFALHSSNLVRIPGNFFAPTPKIRLVSFSYNNKISHVGEGLLDSLEDLEEAHFRYNLCINKGALNSSQVPALIEALKLNCSDIEPETTTTTSTTFQPPKCEISNFEDFVCELEEEIEILRSEVGNLKAKNSNFEGQVESLEGQMKVQRDDFEGQVEVLNSQVETLRDSNQNLVDQVASLKSNLQEVERILLDLTSKPCAC